MHSRFNSSPRFDVRPQARPHAPAAHTTPQPVCRDLRHLAARDYRHLLVSSAFTTATHASPPRNEAEYDADSLGRALVRRCLQQPWVQDHATGLRNAPPLNGNDWRRACVYAAAGAQALEKLDARASNRTFLLAASCRMMRRPASDPNLNWIERNNLDVAYDLIENFGRNKLRASNLEAWLNMKAIVVALHVGGLEAVRRCVMLLPARGARSLDATLLPTAAPDGRAAATRTPNRYTPTQVQQLADGRRVWQPETTFRARVQADTPPAPPHDERKFAGWQSRAVAPLPQRARLENMPATPLVTRKGESLPEEQGVTRKHPRDTSEIDELSDVPSKRPRLPHAAGGAVMIDPSPGGLLPEPTPRGLFAWAYGVVSYAKTSLFGA